MCMYTLTKAFYSNREMSCSEKSAGCSEKGFDVFETLKELLKSSSPVDIAKERYHDCTDHVLKYCSVLSINSTAALTSVLLFQL